MRGRGEGGFWHKICAWVLRQEADAVSLLTSLGKSFDPLSSCPVAGNKIATSTTGVGVGVETTARTWMYSAQDGA